ncbi:hypothetical protein ABT247_25665 [Kitasatospora sp. NPDC001539]|uniref:hypothetical protein n=1 Tax=Kitasatospora sp. NPDC001539 TaxID=3154384 RepID=UPI003318A79F
MTGPTTPSSSAAGALRREDFTAAGVWSPNTPSTSRAICGVGESMAETSAFHAHWTHVAAYPKSR